MNPPAVTSASILCIGLGWFPKNPGGLDRYLYELAHYLALGQNQVELCAVGVPEAEPNYPVKLTNLAQPDSPLWRRLWLSRINFLNSRTLTKPDAINLHFALYSFPLLDILPENVPVTFNFQGPWAIESQEEGASKLNVLFKHWVGQKVYNRCDRFIVLSKAFGTILHQEYHIPWSKINVIPGGVDTTRFQANLSRQEARSQLNWPQDRKILFTPRRLVHRMGIDILVSAIAKIKSKIPDVWLAIAGKGTLRDSLEKQATELGLNNHVQFLGFLPDEQLPIAYQATDLTVVPSQSLEGFGLVILESLACGTPVICTPIGGMPEILTPFSPELITENTDPDGISLKLAGLLTGEITMPSRNACRDYAVTNFNWSKIAEEVREVLLS